jgi:hypothetical protein
MVQARNAYAPQLGFNNNVKHNGRVFHIQTEDSGIAHPHITTHLFADGGRILRTERTDYKELLNSPELVPMLRQRMKEQHRAMFTALRAGQLDHLIDPSARPKTGAPSNSSQVARAGRSAPPARAPSARPARAERDKTPEPGALSARPTVSRRAPVDSSLGHRGQVTMAVRNSLEPQVAVSDAANEKSSASSSGGHNAVRPSLPTANEMSLFGGSARVNEQSLDDIILSYISEDLEGE